VATALITGASGFAGTYLAQHLRETGYHVVYGCHAPLAGSGRSGPSDGDTRVDLDVTDREGLRRIVTQTRPDEVYHLAGLTRPADGRTEEFYGVNFGGALNVLEAVREHAPGSKVLLVGSAYAYGRMDRPISETEPFEPVNHYGVSKAAADLLGFSYALEGLHVVRARPFNHSGPHQSPDFVLPTLVQQFVEIEAGRREPVVHLGNLDSVRDFSDVRDVVRGYGLALRWGRNGEAYNLGSGEGVSVRELFELVRAESDAEVELAVEPSRVRATDIPYLVADVGKAGRELGWQARTPLVQTIRDMLGAARESLKGPPVDVPRPRPSGVGDSGEPQGARNDEELERLRRLLEEKERQILNLGRELRNLEELRGMLRDRDERLARKEREVELLTHRLAVRNHMAALRISEGTPADRPFDAGRGA
jgi:GDP-4-dehydro-6-deoxy-D-mannose reductase